jgi:Heterokaryon incompatibility protein (HET)
VIKNRRPISNKHTKSGLTAAAKSKSVRMVLSEESPTANELLDVLQSLPSKAVSEKLLDVLNVPYFIENFDEYFPQHGQSSSHPKDSSQTYSGSQYEYGYTRLEKGQIRLVMLLPALNTEGEIIARVQPVSLEDKPKYDALCYTWGDMTRRDGPNMFIAGAPFSVINNLAKILRDLRKRHEDATQRIWVDSLSINMQDLDERSEQIRMMGNIYRGAQNVVVILGSYMGGDEVGCKFLKDLADAVSEDLHSTTEASQFAGDFDSKRPLDVVTQPSSHSSALESHVKLSQLATGSRYAPEWTAVASFFDRPLWREVWIVQEIVRARSAILTFGDLSLNLAIVEQVFGSIEWIERMTAAEAASPSHSCDDDPECALCVRRKLFARLGWASAKRILYFRSLLRHGNRVALSRILATFVNQVSSVLFDKVYAFLGLAPDDDARLNCFA